MDFRDIEIVSWDVDGTLYELPRMVRSLWWLGLGGLVRRPIRTVRELRRLGRFRRAMNRVRAAGGALGNRLPADRDELVAIEERWYGRAIARVGLRPGVAELLDRFAGEGVRQVVISDYRADYKLAALALTDRFDRVYAGEQLGYLKPAPELFLRVAADLEVAPGSILHIGDRRDRDGVAAKAAGCRVLIAGEDRLLADQASG
jgi:FMN phosphatase YigB (HAD superfamily)